MNKFESYDNSYDVHHTFFITLYCKEIESDKHFLVADNVKGEERLFSMCSGASTIKSLKQKICSTYELKCTDIQMIFNGERVNDFETMNSLNIDLEDILLVTRKRFGGGLPRLKNGNFTSMMIRECLENSFDEEEISSFNLKETERYENSLTEISIDNDKQTEMAEMKPTLLQSSTQNTLDKMGTVKILYPTVLTYVVDLEKTKKIRKRNHKGKVLEEKENRAPEKVDRLQNDTSENMVLNHQMKGIQKSNISDPSQRLVEKSRIVTGCLREVASTQEMNENRQIENVSFKVNQTKTDMARQIESQSENLAISSCKPYSESYHSQSVDKQNFYNTKTNIHQSKCDPMIEDRFVQEDIPNELQECSNRKKTKTQSKSRNRAKTTINDSDNSKDKMIECISTQLNNTDGLNNALIATTNCNNFDMSNNHPSICEAGSLKHKNKKDRVICEKKSFDYEQEISHDNILSAHEPMDYYDSDNIHPITFNDTTPTKITNNNFQNSFQDPLDEQELESFSLLVHDWSESKFGTKKILQKMVLTEKDFEEMGYFAKENIKYTRIRDKSALELLYLWKNTTKSNLSYRGHPETGFETNMQHHNPSVIFCPYQHCSPEKPSQIIDQIVHRHVTPQKKTYQEQQQTSRNLFDNNTNGNRLEPGSPTQAKLNKQRIKLLSELKTVTKKLKKYQKSSDNKLKSKSFTSSNLAVLKCQSQSCKNTYTTTTGLRKHHKKEHPDEPFEPIPQECKICGQSSIFIDKHYKTVHKNMFGDTCEVCGKVVLSDMKTHRGDCQKCPMCDNFYGKKDRVLNHMKKCNITFPQQNEALDLTSPIKKSNDRILISNGLNTMRDVEEGDQQHSLVGDELLKGVDLSFKVPHPIHKESLPELSESQQERANSRIKEPEKDKHQMINLMEDCDDQTYYSEINSVESQYKMDYTEDYMSEREPDDDEEFSVMRLKKKNEIEAALRKVDEEKDERKEEVDKILYQFETFLKQPHIDKSKASGSNNPILPKTIKSYVTAVERGLFPVLYNSYEPFYPNWLLDPVTIKNCTFDGQERHVPDLKDPIFITTRILKKSLKKYDDVDAGQQMANLVSGIVKFMKFLEVHFAEREDLYGNIPFNKVKEAHDSVRSYIEGTQLWTVLNKQRDNQRRNNKKIQKYENPNREARILEKYYEYQESDYRSSKVDELAYFAREDTPVPSDSVMNGISNFVMSEGQMATGARPCCIYRLPNGAYTEKLPGFPPYDPNEEDCNVPEYIENIKIYRRVDPNLPPKKLACVHQRESGLAICPVGCPDECKPVGYNILCTWDKNRDKVDPSYIHLTRPLKVMFDLYRNVKKKFFAAKKFPERKDPYWFENEDIDFFLKASGTSFDKIDLKEVSKVMGEPVVPYDFRDIWVSFCLNHKNKEIQNAESDVLRHGQEVAEEFYRTNKQLRPQTVTQAFVQEERVYPPEILEKLEKAETLIKSKAKNIDEKSQQQKHNNMLKRKQAMKEALKQLRPLGPNNRISLSDGDKFIDLIETITSKKIENIAQDYTALKWRSFVVRTVCTSVGHEGKLLQELWINMYRGDLKNGIRDARKQAQRKGWPRKDSRYFVMKNDRNTWIAGFIFKYIEQKVKRVLDKKSLLVS